MFLLAGDPDGLFVVCLFVCLLQAMMGWMREAAGYGSSEDWIGLFGLPLKRMTE